MDREDMLNALHRKIAEVMPTVDGVIALRREGEGAIPHLFLPGDDMSDLTLWPRFPISTPARLIQNRYPDKRFAVVVRGCDDRHLVEMAKRLQVDLGPLTLIGVACSHEQAEICRCDLPFPRRVDIGETVEGIPQDFLDEFVGRPRQERLAFWKHQFSKCIKCYGCRTICPVCFCSECVLENKLFVEGGKVPPPFLTFHLIRAMHMVGRCVECGECEEACPAGIPLMTLYKLLQRDVENVFGYVAGANPDEPPVMDTATYLEDQALLRPPAS